MSKHANKLRSELDFIRNIATAADQDWAVIDRYLPASKRGANLTRAFESLRRRIEMMSACAADAEQALAALLPGDQP